MKCCFAVNLIKLLSNNLFLEKYFPRVKREEKETEFISLKQGNLSLVEYERKFDKLSRYALHLVDTEERKARRFERGLRPELYKAVAMFQFSTYSEILQRVQLIAKDYGPEVGKPIGSSSTPAKKQWKGGFPQKRKFDGKPWSSGNRGETSNTRFKAGDNRPGVPQCGKCGRQHFGECWGKTIV